MCLTGGRIVYEFAILPHQVGGVSRLGQHLWVGARRQHPQGFAAGAPPAGKECVGVFSLCFADVYVCVQTAVLWGSALSLLLCNAARACVHALSASPCVFSSLLLYHNVLCVFCTVTSQLHH